MDGTRPAGTLNQMLKEGFCTDEKMGNELSGALWCWDILESWVPIAVEDSPYTLYDRSLVLFEIVKLLRF
jgi:hypothetical protein